MSSTNGLVLTQENTIELQRQAEERRKEEMRVTADYAVQNEQKKLHKAVKKKKENLAAISQKKKHIAIRKRLWDQNRANLAGMALETYRSLPQRYMEQRLLDAKKAAARASGSNDATTIEADEAACRTALFGCSTSTKCTKCSP